MRERFEFVGLRLKLEKSRDCDWSAGTPMMDHHFLSQPPERVPGPISLSTIARTRSIVRGHTRRCPYRTVDDEYPIFLHLHLRITSLKFARVVPVRRHPFFRREDPLSAKREGTDASRGHPGGISREPFRRYINNPSDGLMDCSVLPPTMSVSKRESSNASVSTISPADVRTAPPFSERK